MNRLDVLPAPNKVDFQGGRVRLDSTEITAAISGALEEEEYVLSVKEDGVKLSGGSEKALFYGKQTLSQLGAETPGVIIKDKPAFPYRGFMLDCSRHFFSVEEIKKLVDAAASLKMNVFHWHLTDDQGFRMFSRRRPEAALKGSVRKSSNFGNLREIGEYRGYFSPESLAETVDYCAERHITVIPEFDMPGHCSALISAYPELSCSGEKIEVKTSQGIFDDVLCAGNDKVFDVIFDILSDALEIFPSEYIHIGGDEAPKKRWKSCPKCQKRIRDEGLENEEALQGWFMNKIVDFLNSKGRKAVVWNDALKSGLVKNVLVQRWLGNKKNVADFADGGGKIINSDFFRYYCDYPYGTTPLSKTYKYSPLLKGAKRSGSVVGVETPIWTEYINNFDRLCRMFFPRFAAVAETGWTRRENKNLADFERRFKIYSKILDGFGVKYAPPEEWNPGFFKSIAESRKFYAGVLNKKE